MKQILRYIHLPRPRIGWRLAWLAFAAAICPAFAAVNSQLITAPAMFFWAGLIGLLLGLRLGRPIPIGHARLAHALRWALWLIGLVLIAALLIMQAIQSLPPRDLLVQDLIAFLNWWLAFVRKQVSYADLPDGRSWGFLEASLTRFAKQLWIAPSDGERGARLLLTTGGVLVTWISTLTLGYGLAKRRNMFVWILPLLSTIGLLNTLGASTGSVLPITLVVLLTLALVAGFARREYAWTQAGIDYSDELGVDVLAWGGSLIVAILLLALIIPTSLDNPLAALLWRDVELPSGIAVLERDIPHPHNQSSADIGLSTLPALELGRSLEQQPPEAIALRVHVAPPLQNGPWPRYWRARIFNLYNGRGWTTNAHIGEFDGLIPSDTAALPGMIAQDIEDLRHDRSVLIGLPTILSVSIGAQAERLTDGSLTALTTTAPDTHYRVLSTLPELVVPPPTDRAPPDMSPYLGLPSNLPVRVADLAHQIVGSETSTYEQGLALETYLRSLNYAYQVQPVPSNGDAVEQFLFDMRQGYCTYYASAMVVMARSQGIPARVAVGYATGIYDPSSDSYIVREADAHAWPELYIDGRWLAFEPTPIRPLPARAPADVELPATAAARVEQAHNSNGPLIWVGVLAAFVLLTWIGFWLSRPRQLNTLATQLQLRLERDGVRTGVPWPPGATLHEYAELLKPRMRGDTRALYAVVELIAQARYSGRTLRGDEEGRLRTAFEQVSARLKRQ